ncbi:MAG: TatD family hydrolase [Chloroflexi bacterium]|nr:TatD family hydrolase [Chloroflexota bacterium]
MLIDCHVHLESYPDDEIEQVLARAREVGVGFVISAGTTLKSSERTARISARFPDLFAGVGIHPMDIEAPFTDETYAALHRLATSSDKVIVISEIGLDFMEGAPDRSIQYPALREQIRLARDLGLPIVFHSRDSHDEIFRVLREERAYEVGGIMHYFQGDERTAKTAIDLGFYISLARPLLRLPHLQEVAAGLSLDNIVLETDSAPQPFKAKRESWTEPRHTRVVAEKLAELQARTLDEVQEITSRNMKDVLGEKWPVVQGYLDSVRDPS